MTRLGLLILIMLLPCLAFAAEEQSVCYGTPSAGRLEKGVSLPSSGPNFHSYSSLGNLLGRAYVHSRARDVILAAYKDLETRMPDTVFVYGETGSRKGGPFKPHKTHQNGLSVDFMVPVRKGGKSVPLPTGPFNKFGYAIEFSKEGIFQKYAIDFEAIGAHLEALHRQATAQGLSIRRVIFDPELQPRLFQTAHGAYLKKNLVFSQKRAWVRHDEHYHVDFDIPCKDLKPPVL